MEEGTPMRRGLSDRAGLATAPGRHAFGNLASLLRRGDVAPSSELELAQSDVRVSMAPPIRHELVASVRKLLADDAYLLDGMLELAIDRMTAKIA